MAETEVRPIDFVELSLDWRTTAIPRERIRGTLSRRWLITRTLSWRASPRTSAGKVQDRAWRPGRKGAT